MGWTCRCFRSSPSRRCCCGVREVRQRRQPGQLRLHRRRSRQARRSTASVWRDLYDEPGRARALPPGTLPDRRQARRHARRVRLVGPGQLEPHRPEHRLVAVPGQTPPPTRRPAQRPSRTISSARSRSAALSLLESDGGNNNGTRIAGTQLTGWDLHSNQGFQIGRAHSELLSWLGLRVALAACGAFGSQPIDPRELHRTSGTTRSSSRMSEFGRTTDQNGSSGTDHAAASCMWVAGGSGQRRRLQL